MLEFRNLKDIDWKAYQEIDMESFENDNVKKEDFSRWLDSDGLIGAFVDSKLVGYLMLRYMEDYGHLARIAVGKSERGKGFGFSLMNYAETYYKDRKIARIGLYVETRNEVAISLYKKSGYCIMFESWHYRFEEDIVRSIEEEIILSDSTNMRVLTISDYETVVSTFPTINKEELKDHLSVEITEEYEGSIPLGLFIEGNLEVYGRFSSSFSGCRPFLCTETIHVKEFVANLKPFRKKDYFRITFDRDKRLAEFCENNGYRLWHHLYFMEKKI